MSSSAYTAVVFGARHLGRGIVRHLADHQWHVIGVARSHETIASLTEELPGVIGIRADVSEPRAAAAVLAGAAERFGSVELVVNAIVDTEVATAAFANESTGDRRLHSRLGSAIDPVHNVVRASLDLLAAQQAGTLIQITGGLALRARRGTAELAATGYATRGLIEGSIADARERGVHVVLLVVRGVIESELTTEMLEGKPPGASMVDADVTAAIDFLVAQTRSRAWTHELTLTPPKAAWFD